MSTAPTPKRGEIWQVDFDPSVGAEIRKVRPAVVMTVTGIGRLPLQIVVPNNKSGHAFENLMLNWLWNLWRALMRFFVREDDDESEEGPIETAFQISCLILASSIGLAILLSWFSR